MRKRVLVFCRSERDNVLRTFRLDKTDALNLWRANTSMRSYFQWLILGWCGVGVGFMTVRADERQGVVQLVFQRSLSHNNAVYGVAFSRDGSRVATASLDNTVKLWMVASGAHVATLRGHGDGVAFVDYLSDGTLATASLDGTLKLWPADGGDATRTFTGHQGYLSCAAAARDRPLLVSGGFDKTVRVWDAQGGTAVATFTGHTANVLAVAITPEGRVVASGGDDRSIRLWDVQAKKELRAFTGHDRAVQALAFSTKDEILASGSTDGSVRLWNIAGKELAVLTGSVPVKSLAFAPHGRMLAVGTRDGVLRLLSVPDLREVGRIAAHKNTIYGVAFHPMGTLLASAGFDSVIQIWQVR